MTRIATTLGLYPLPDWAKTALTDLKGRQRADLIDGTESGEIQDVYAEAREAVIDRQVEAGLDRIVEGQLRWDDMLGHPLAVCDVVETGGLVRYYDNNNFYRELTVTGELSATGDVADELTAARTVAEDRPLLAVLPGPYTLADLATDAYYGDADTFRSAIAEFLAAEVEALPTVETLFLLEPSLASHPPENAGFVDAIDNVARGVDRPGTDVVVQPYWGTPPDAVYERLLDAPIDGIGYDLVTAADAVHEQVRSYGTPDAVSLGIVDGQNTRVESTEEIDAAVADFHEVAGTVETTYLTTNTEAFYLPVGPFEAKLDVLGRAAAAREAPA